MCGGGAGLQWDGSVLLLPPALEPNRCSEGSDSSQVFPGTMRFSWEHVGSEAGAEQYLRNHRGGQLHPDNNPAKCMLEQQ